MIARRWTAGLAALLGLTALTGCNSAQVKALKEEQQRLNTIIINYEKENRELMAQVEQAEIERRKALLEAEAKERQIAVLRDGMQSLRGSAHLEGKIQQQLEILAERLGGTLVDNRLQLPGDFFFGSGQYTLRPEARSALQELTQILRDENLMLMITGHTDSDPVKHSRKKGIEDNRHLSVMRALNVLEEMKKHGYPGELLYPTGWGELRPVSSNDSKQGKARNRRVEIYIDPAASGFFSNVAITDVARPVGGYDGEGPVITSGTATLE